MDTKENYSIRLTNSMVEILKTIGEGSLSDGIRTVVKVSPLYKAALIKRDRDHAMQARVSEKHRVKKALTDQMLYNNV